MSGPVRVDLRDARVEEGTLRSIRRHLEAGGLIAYPTETVYGFGCLAKPAPVATLAALKGRGPDQPFLLLTPDLGATSGLVWTDDARALAEAFWPGPLTLVLADPTCRFPSGVRSPDGAVAVRLSAHPLVQRLLDGLGGALTSTSANAPGSPAATDAQSALEAARQLGAGSVLWVLDAGPLPASRPSTIVDCSGRTPWLRREGAIGTSDLLAVLPQLSTPEIETR